MSVWIIYDNLNPSWFSGSWYFPLMNRRSCSIKAIINCVKLWLYLGEFDAHIACSCPNDSQNWLINGFTVWMLTSKQRPTKGWCYRHFVFFAEWHQFNKQLFSVFRNLNALHFVHDSAISSYYSYYSKRFVLENHFYCSRSAAVEKLTFEKWKIKNVVSGEV